MRTSATGRAEAERGFTLVELLIVLTVVGLLSAAVVIAVPDGGGSLRSEAERFAARAQAAQEKALIDARPVALRVTAAGYSFEERLEQKWRPLAAGSLGPESWREGTVVLGADMRLIFDPTGLAEPAELLLARDGERLAVRVAANGAISIDG